MYGRHSERSEESRYCKHSRYRSNLSANTSTVWIFLCWLVICLTSAVSQSQIAQLAGAWRQSGIKWTKPPADLHLKERTADAGILYFGPDHQFVLLYAYVIQGPTWETISRGDGQVVYLGTWRQDGEVIHVELQLTSRTIQKVGETLPGPMQREDIRVVSRSIVFEKMHFRRDVRLDKELRVTNQGERARLASQDHSVGAP